MVLIFAQTKAKLPFLSKCIVFTCVGIKASNFTDVKTGSSPFFVFKHMAPQGSQTILAKENQTWWRDFTFDMVHLIWIFVQDNFSSWIKVIHRGCDKKVLITKSKICQATILYFAFHCKAKNTFKSWIVLGKRIRTVRCKIFTANPLMVIPHQKASFNLILFTRRPIF